MTNKTADQKAFALACRFLADNIGYPAIYTPDLTYPECDDNPEKCKNEAQWKCWQRYFRDKIANEPVCHICGCTNDNACPGGCSWAADDLCSACSSAPIEDKHAERGEENG